MRYGSVCSGIEAATAAWEPLGWKPAFFSEIEAFPRAVLAHHYPDVPCHGDFTTIQQGDYATIDVLVGGTPCQDFSLAGLRAGMDGDRGGLTLEFGKLAGRLRPQWLVWENVPGVFSSNGGRDFAGFLGLLTGKSVEVPIVNGKRGWSNSGVLQGIPDAYSVAWRVLDAQFAGTPQRRRRVFLVGCLGADWRRPLAVLLERHSLSGDPAPSREKGKGASTCFETGPGGYNSSQVSPTIDTRVKNGPMQNQVGLAIVGHAEYSDSHHPLPEGEGGDCGGGSDGLIVMSTGQGGAEIAVDRCTTLTCNHEAPIVVKTCDTGSNGDNYNTDGVAYTLDTVNGQAVVQPIAFTQNQRDELRDLEDLAGCLSSQEGMKQRTYLASSVDEECNANTELHGPLLRGGEGGTRQTIIQIPDEPRGAFVRRLTPKEASRLQGFPDDFARIPWRLYKDAVKRGVSYESVLLENGKKLREPAGEDCPDGPQYKCYGNSMAVPVMAWIGKRIQMVHALIMSGQAT